MMKKVSIILGMVLVASLVCASGLYVPQTSGDNLGKASKPFGTFFGAGISVTNEFAISSTVAAAVVRVTGFEAKDAQLILDADEGDDNADTFLITSVASDNTLTFANHTTTILTLSSAGVLTLADGETITDASDVVTIASDDNHGTLAIQGFEAKDALLLLQADESDDNGDDWQMVAQQSGNALVFQSDTSGSMATKLTLSTAGLVTLVNGTTINNSDANTLTITEATVDIDGASTATSYTSDADITAAQAGEVKGGKLGIEDGTADGYFERVANALNWVEGGVTNEVVADVTS